MHKSRLVRVVAGTSMRSGVPRPRRRSCPGHRGHLTSAGMGRTSERNLLAADARVYLPDAVVARRSEPLPTAWSTKRRFATDVITCAASNLMNPLAEGIFAWDCLLRLVTARFRTSAMR